MQMHIELRDQKLCGPGGGPELTQSELGDHISVVLNSRFCGRCLCDFVPYNS